VHKERPFFKDLVDFMISGPVMIQALEGENAIAKNRELMGATDPKKADKGTIRADFADSIDANAVHGSDAAETAAVEVAFFFPGMNVYSALIAHGRGSRPMRPCGHGAAINLLGTNTRPRRAGAWLRASWARSAFAPRPAVPLDPPAGAADFAQMSDLAKSLRDKLADQRAVEGLPVLTEHARPTARSSGCSTSAAAMRSRPCSSPRTTAARCAFRRRPAARSGCRFCSTGHQGFSRNLTTGEIVAQLWFAEHQLRRACGSRRARHQQRGDDGHGRAAAELRALVPALRDHARRPRLRPVAPPRHGVHLGRGADDRPPGPIARWRWRCRCTRPTTRCATPGAAEPQVPAGRTAGRLQRYLEAAPRDFITFEYCMLDGVNDSPSRPSAGGAGAPHGRACPASST
jgi:hypothetical protein